jgi:hypothetical protein
MNNGTEAVCFVRWHGGVAGALRVAEAPERQPGTPLTRVATPS